MFLFDSLNFSKILSVSTCFASLFLRFSWWPSVSACLFSLPYVSHNFSLFQFVAAFLSASLRSGPFYMLYMFLRYVFIVLFVSLCFTPFLIVIRRFSLSEFVSLRFYVSLWFALFLNEFVTLFLYARTETLRNDEEQREAKRSDEKRGETYDHEQKHIETNRIKELQRDARRNT